MSECGDAAALMPLINGLRSHSLAPVFVGGLMEPLSNRVVLTEFFATRTDALVDLRIDPGKGVGGSALALGRPVKVRSYQGARGIDDSYSAEVAAEGLSAMYALPVRVKDGPSGLIYGAFRHDVDIPDRLVDTAVEQVRQFEFDAAVRIAADKQVRDLRELATQIARDAPSEAQTRAALREVHAELQHLCNNSADNPLRARLEDVLHNLELRTKVPSIGHSTAEQPVSLTRRELDVLAQVAGGRTAAEAAAGLELGVATVKGYLKTCYRKLGAHNRVEAIDRARLAGLVI